MSGIFRHPLFIGIASTILGTVVAAQIVAYINSESLFNSIRIVLQSTLNFIKSILTFGVPLWILFSLVVLYIFIRKITRILVSEDGNILNLYKTDIIDNIKWEWNWNWNYKYDIDPKKLIPFCKKCNGYLIMTESQDYRRELLVCEVCGFSKEIKGSLIEYKEKVLREIIRKIRNNEWQGKN